MSPPAAPVAPPPPAAQVVTNKVAEGGEDNSGALFAEISALGETGVRSSLKKATKGPVNVSVPSEPKKPGMVMPMKKKVDLGGTSKCGLSGKK